MSSCDKFLFMHSCKRVSSSLTDAAFIELLTLDLVGNVSYVTHFEFFFRIRNEFSHSLNGFVGDCEALWFEQSFSICRYVLNLRIGFSSFICLLDRPV